jgi:hypothetical protein
MLLILLHRILNALSHPGGKNTISFSVFCMNSTPSELQSLLLMNLHNSPGSLQVMQPAGRRAHTRCVRAALALDLPAALCLVGNGILGRAALR